MLTFLREIEADVNRLENDAFEHPTEADRRRIVMLRGRLFRLMQVIVPQRDMLADGADVIERVLSMGAGQAHHPFADIRDDLVLAVNLVAYCRELLAEALNVHLQATSNRLNTIATRLTVLATIFVPLTLITGFFGQNFGWMVDHIDVARVVPRPRRRRRASCPAWRHLARGCGGGLPEQRRQVVFAPRRPPSGAATWTPDSWERNTDGR